MAFIKPSLCQVVKSFVWHTDCLHCQHSGMGIWLCVHGTGDDIDPTFQAITISAVSLYSQFMFNPPVTVFALVDVLIMELDWPAMLVCMPCPSMRCSVACDVVGPILSNIQLSRTESNSHIELSHSQDANVIQFVLDAHVIRVWVVGQFTELRELPQAGSSGY
ncbi:hypothetical protein EDB89DRAFT_1913440 [Lactarius sanguifluus]|nr:hypothetical protein EDB89DRAFT_1913440 [Lactarius sanguifluus]